MVMYGTRSGTIRARISFVQNFHQLLIKKKEKKKERKKKKKKKVYMTISNYKKQILSISNEMKMSRLIHFRGVK
jgi:hypothetical protein